MSEKILNLSYGKGKNIPNDEYEDMLLKIIPSYLEEIGPKKIFDYKKLSDYFQGFKITKIEKTRIIFIFTIWFNINLFNTFVKYIPIWIITIPLGDLLSSNFHKTVFITLKKTLVI
jgi:hypothetical protein